MKKGRTPPARAPLGGRVQPAEQRGLDDQSAAAEKRFRRLGRRQFENGDVDSLRPEDSGRFWSYDGTNIPR